MSGNSGNGVPTGTVTFKDNGAAITGIPALTLNSQGNVLPTNPTFTFTAGTHPITAAYSGDPSFNASTSTRRIFHDHSSSNPNILKPPPHRSPRQPINHLCCAERHELRQRPNRHNHIFCRFDADWNATNSAAIYQSDHLSAQRLGVCHYQHLTFWAKHDYCEVQRRCQLRRYHFCAGLNIHRDHYHQRHQHLGLDDSAGPKRNLHFDRDPESIRRPGTNRHRAIHRERHRHRQRRGAQRRKSASGQFLASSRHGFNYSFVFR